MRVYALVPARSGSKGLPDKNILPIAGHPLLGHAIAFGKRCNSVDRVFVSTDSDKYRDIALTYGAEVPCLRGVAASGDTAMEEDILADIAVEFPRRGIPMPDIWVWLKPTSPLRRVSAVDEAVKILSERDFVSAVRIVSEADARLHVIDKVGLLKPLLKSWPADRSKIRRTEVPQAYHPFNLEVFRHSMWEKRGGNFMGDAIVPIVEPEFTGLDINGRADYEILKALIEAKPDCLSAYVHLR